MGGALLNLIVVALGLGLLAWMYHIAPPRRTAWRRDVPGAVLALVVWLAGSSALRLYATGFVDPESPYGYFGTPLVVLLWIYLSAVALLIGAELNAEIEKMWPTAEGLYSSLSTSPVGQGRAVRPGAAGDRWHKAAEEDQRQA